MILPGYTHTLSGAVGGVTWGESSVMLCGLERTIEFGIYKQAAISPPVISSVCGDGIYLLWLCMNQIA